MVSPAPLIHRYTPGCSGNRAICSLRSWTGMSYYVEIFPAVRTLNYSKRMTFTGVIGRVCMYPLRAIINASVALGIHPNVLTLVGVLINVGAACALGVGRLRLAFVIMLVANIFD